MENKKSSTLDYYDQYFQEFIDNTFKVDMISIYERFLPLLPKEAKLLDVGCGSGRDTIYFKGKGFQVDSFDGSKNLVKRCQEIGLDTKLTSFEEFNSDKFYDGIWACSSLLHLNQLELTINISKFLSFLKAEGFFYLSFKYGHGEEMRDGRFFKSFDEDTFKTLLDDLDAEVVDLWTTTDLRPGKAEKWLNAIIQNKKVPRNET